MIIDFNENTKCDSIKELFSHTTRYMSMPENILFLGVLNEFDIENPSNEMIEFLIKKEYYIENPDGDFERYSSFNPITYNECFGAEIEYKGKFYDVNVFFFKEIYLYAEGIVKVLYRRNFKSDIYVILLKLKGFLERNEQIAFLKHTLENCFNEKGYDAEIFLDYLEGFRSTRYSYENWEDYFTTQIPCEDEIYKYYLNTTSSENLTGSKILDEHIPLWLKFYRKEKLINFCREKIQELENNTEKSISYEKSITSNRNDFAKHIFKTFESEQKFRFLVSKIDSDKNPAFFSYLFFYFQNEINEIIVLGNTNKGYIDFVKQNFSLDNFSRIIKSNTENSKKEREMYSAFETKLKSCSFDE